MINKGVNSMADAAASANCYELSPVAMKLIPAKCFVAATLALSVLGSMGCATPQSRVNHLAEEAGFARRLAPGKGFEHIVYEHKLDTYTTPELHIYIDGDGTPWVAGRYPSANPTPRRPMALEMMSEDPAPAIYLGRPCYFGLESSANCGVEFWTSRRYSPEVVASMLSVILARDLQQPVFLLTIAANLDTELWTELRGFLPLEGSLNPIHYRADTAHIPQLHLAGLQDKIVPVAVTESYTSGLDTQFSRDYPDFDHACCWLELWPEILAEKPWDATTRE
jgi:hypothetical protein